MRINPQYLKLLKESGLANTPSQVSRGIFFGFLITFQDDYPMLQDYLLDDEEHRAIFPYEDYQVYQINLCRTDDTSLKTRLKIPFFSTLDSGEFKTFLNLLTQNFISGNGHLNNQQDYSIFNNDMQVDTDSYEQAKANLGTDFNLNKMVQVVSRYYLNTKPAKSLTNYLNSAAFLQDYNTYFMNE